MTSLTGPITGGGRGWPFGAAAFDLAAFGYVEEEYFLEGEAVRYRHAAGTERTFDGHWAAEPAGSAPFRTRMLIRRPADQATFNGTVVTLWNNVSRGFDIFVGESPEIYRGGYGIVLVSAQRVGVHGYPLTAERGLVGWDPARYGTLHIENDDYGFDIFTQAARLVGPDRPKLPVDPMGGLRVEKIIAAGASQSAVRLATYLNAIQPTEKTFDGFYILIYFGNGAPLEDPFGGRPMIQRVEDIMPAAKKMPAGSHLLRDDLGIPVFVLNSETESTNYYPVRQPDSDTFRFWEVAGVAHGQAAGSAKLLAHEPRDFGLVKQEMAPESGTNVLSHEPVNSAALSHFQRWLSDGVPPPVQPRLEFAGTPPRVVRDDLGIAVGGVRIPQVEVPTARHTGVDADGVLEMFGTTTPFTDEILHRLYASPADYRQKLAEAAARAVAAGILLKVDADEIIAASETAA
jgi:hypothetical protein